jgi:hypothetical protein
MSVNLTCTIRTLKAECDFDTHESVINTYEFDYNTHECDFDVYECNFDTQKCDLDTNVSYVNLLRVTLNITNLN